MVKICYSNLSYLGRREPKAIFDTMMGWYPFFIYLSGPMYFSAPVKVIITKNLKS